MSSATKLPIIEAGVEAVLGEEGGMMPFFHNAALIQDVDAVGTADGAEAVGDDDGGASHEEPIEGLLDLDFGDGVDIGGGFIQDQNAGGGEHGTGDADELALAEREIDAAFLNAGLVAIRQGADKIVGVGLAGDFLNLLLRGIRQTVADVLGDGAGEEEGHLRDDTDLAVQGGLGDGANIDIIDQDGAFGDFVKAGDQIGDGGFAGAGGSDNGDGFGGLDEHVDAIQDDGCIRAVTESDIAQFDLALNGRQADGIGGVFDFEGIIEELDDLLPRRPWRTGRWCRGG